VAGDAPTSEAAPSWSVVSIAGIGLTLIGASLEGWGDHTWWGVIGDQRGPTPAHVPFMVSVAPAIVVVVIATLSLRMRGIRLWFGPAVAVAALMWLAQVVAWIFLYRDLTGETAPATGAWLMVAGLALTIGGALLDTISHHRRLPPRLATGLRDTPAMGAIAGLVAAFLGATAPIWGRDNPWGAPLPPIPVGVNPDANYDETVTWWGVLGPDPDRLVGVVTELTIVVLPAVIVALSALLPLLVRPVRRWFGPAVAAAATMWLVWMLAWWGIYEDHVDSVTWDAGSVMMALGLLVATGAALADASEELSEPEQL